MLIFTRRLPRSDDASVNPTPLLTLSLTCEERLKSRHRLDPADGQPLFVHLARGTILHDGDILQAETGERLQIIAKPEPVLTVTAKDSYTLLRAAYHLGNRHVPLEITPDYLRLTPDPVLQQMLELLEVEIVEDILPFNPEMGAYHQH